MYVLVIDDEPDSIQPIIIGLERMKRKANWDYYSPDKTNLKEIKMDLQHNLMHSPDVILLDIMMPDAPGGDKNKQGGLVLLEEFKRNKFEHIKPTAKVILMSATMDMESIYKTHAAHIYRTITKPADLRDLFDIMKEIDGG